MWLSHPGKLNALSVSMWKDITEYFRKLSADTSLRVVILRGEGGAFASGADISEFPQRRATREQVSHYHDQIIGDALRAIVHCPVPVLAAIDGPCVGAGLEIAAACDLRICSDRSSFGIPIGRLGFPLAPHESACVVSVLGRANALELLLEGRIWSASEALSKGLVNRSYPNEDWEAEVQAAVARLASGAPHAARRNKWLVDIFSRIDEQTLLSVGQREACWDFVETRDYARGIDAFMSKTRPAFQDD
ncbi:MAG: enoyl-CoA hydratase/isomerase family protein [Betaproteobacteria bacterium]|nr:enoyl-CoA hydratase/isomerase family protein [Betaproteobacteria bacterium]NDF04359.1 enoyl-CoA hydratase/isomerase family protein [Betaproteobacteria bacterium]